MTCPVCGQEKPPRLFERDPNRRNPRCKACVSGRVSTRQKALRRGHLRIEGGVIYVVRAVGTPYFKVGVAVDVTQRIKDLQCGCPFELRLVRTIEGGRSEERALHRQLEEYHVRGEWFRLPDGYWDTTG